ncbi:hypothetical protein FocTR4_00007784 [Fusarium oxysporum f. sp. cubense]|uniref:Branched-chain-amino-acid aminotransferase n=2 Tax=Fusarium oxysporum species complex TaxID=171631 RepID=A0A5C6TLR1_FUSOC|nr:hypothetical protein FocTR4_00007784 [Fusarium oxysporum f. sp. cubense]
MATMQEIFKGFEERQAKLVEDGLKNPLAHGAALIEGQITPLLDAKIPILDQGFLHSDLTYDVPAVWDGKLFRFNDHLDRLERSSASRTPMFRSFIVTRGFRFIREPLPTNDTPESNFIYILVMPYIWVMPYQMQPVGGEAVVTRTVRRIPPGAIDPTVKNLQWGDLIRGLLEAQDRGSQYPFLTDGDGNITEGAGYNIIFVKDGALYTAKKGVLEGITRKSVFDVAEKAKIPIHLDDVPASLAYVADEIFMCTTAGGIMPITKLDGESKGEVGPITKLIWDGYWAMHYDPRYTAKISYE